jgi:prepilin peptidase CpaA
MKIMGGGDSKFLATIFLLIPLRFQDTVFYYLLISTIIIGSISFIQNIIINWDLIANAVRSKEKGAIRKCFGRKFPYAPVVLLTWGWFGWTIYS